MPLSFDSFAFGKLRAGWERLPTAMDSLLQEAAYLSGDGPCGYSLVLCQHLSEERKD
jgi:hypothetical protein